MGRITVRRQRELQPEGAGGALAVGIEAADAAAQLDADHAARAGGEVRGELLVELLARVALRLHLDADRRSGNDGILGVRLGVPANIGDTNVDARDDARARQGITAQLFEPLHEQRGHDTPMAHSVAP